MPVAIVPHTLNKCEASHENDKYHQALQKFVHRFVTKIKALAEAGPT
jgi:hypothetical protein